MPEQVHQKIEDLRLDGDQAGAAAQFAAIRVECTILEVIAQGLIRSRHAF